MYPRFNYGIYDGVQDAQRNFVGMDYRVQHKKQTTKAKVSHSADPAKCYVDNNQERGTYL